MPGEWQAGELPSTLRGEKRATPHRVVTLVREPVARFVSAVGELLARSIGGVCPDGPCGAIDAFSSTTVERLANHTTWYAEAARLASLRRRAAAAPAAAAPAAAAAASVREGSASLRPLLSAFLHDVACLQGMSSVYGGEHFLPQTWWLNPSTPVAPLAIRSVRALQIEELFPPAEEPRIEPLLELLELPTEVEAEVRARAPECAARSTTNVAADKPLGTGVPSSTELRQVLDADPDLLTLLCTCYASDFSCLGYELPAPCRRTFMRNPDASRVPER